MKVLRHIQTILKKRRMHMTLIDPANQSHEEAGRIAKIAEEIGTDAIMVGGSTGFKRRKLDTTVLSIKKNVCLPIILFPNGSEGLSKYADAVFFMSMLNSRNIRFLVREQAKGAFFIKKMNIETIPMGYIIFEPGMRVGKIGEADLVKRDDTKTAIGYALASQYFGMKLVYLEAGSGAQAPIPKETILVVKENVDIPVIVGGGIKNGRDAGECIKGGADIIVTGNLVEEESFIALKEVIKEVRKDWDKR
ncbi:MAG: geranylgeranylglyceryl/heptaprenylglyceryl phosphate synthase [Candidatus Thermoplasmatota archaeon]